MGFREWYEQDGCYYAASEASLKSTWIAAKESAKREIDNLRAENEALYEDNKALRDYIASLMSTMPKIKAATVREAAEYLESHQSTSKTDCDLLNKYADKLEQGECLNTDKISKKQVVREFLDSVNDTNQLSTRDMQFLSKFACLYFEGES